MGIPPLFRWVFAENRTSKVPNFLKLLLFGQSVLDLSLTLAKSYDNGIPVLEIVRFHFNLCPNRLRTYDRFPASMMSQIDFTFVIERRTTNRKRSFLNHPLGWFVMTLLWLVSPLESGRHLSAVVAQEASSQASFGPTGPVELVKDGFQFTEGPAWGPDQSLYFTDIPANRIYRFVPKDGVLDIFIEPTGHSNGLMFDSKGQLLACQMDGQLVSIELATKAVTVLSDKHNNIRFNACNDLVIDSLGGIYFTDPRYQSPEPYPQGTEAFYYRAADGTVTRLGQDLLAPNGIGLSPDGKTLFVVPSMQKQVMAYPIEAPGKIGTGRVLFELKQPDGEDNTGGDGMTVDVDGNLYVTSALGVQVCDQQGKLLTIINVPEVPANVTFGGDDFKMLYITARKGLYRCPMPVAGLVFGKSQP
jgi:gluconolactonase